MHLGRTADGDGDADGVGGTGKGIVIGICAGLPTVFRGGKVAAVAAQPQIIGELCLFHKLTLLVVFHAEGGLLQVSEAIAGVETNIIVHGLPTVFAGHIDDISKAVEIVGSHYEGIFVGEAAALFPCRFLVTVELQSDGSGALGIVAQHIRCQLVSGGNAHVLSCAEDHQHHAVIHGELYRLGHIWGRPTVQLIAIACGDIKDDLLPAHAALYRYDNIVIAGVQPFKTGLDLDMLYRRGGEHTILYLQQFAVLIHIADKADGGDGLIIAEAEILVGRCSAAGADIAAAGDAACKGEYGGENQNDGGKEYGDRLRLGLFGDQHDALAQATLAARHGGGVQQQVTPAATTAEADKSASVVGALSLTQEGDGGFITGKFGVTAGQCCRPPNERIIPVERQRCGAEDAPNMVAVAIVAQLVAQHMAQGNFVRRHGGSHIDGGGNKTVEAGGLHHMGNVDGAGTIHLQPLPRAAQTAGEHHVDTGKPHRHKDDACDPRRTQDVFAEVLHITGALPAGELLLIGTVIHDGVGVRPVVDLHVVYIVVHDAQHAAVIGVFHGVYIFQPLQIL